MAVNINDLPPKAREQVAGKLLKQRKRADALKTSKYNSQRASRLVQDGNEIRFDSQKEARRYDELLARLRAGRIKDLKLQPEFTLQESYRTPEGVLVRAIRYRADFSYMERAVAHPLEGPEEVWRQVVEDVKSEATKTRVYAMKRKMLMETHGIYIREV